MTKSQLLTAVAGSFLVLALAVYNTPAQQPRAPVAAVQSGAPAAAMLDISYIFKNHARFKGMMSDMKADVGRAQEQLKKERDTIRNLVERLKDFRPGTPDYKALEEETAKRQADAQVQMQLQRKEFLQQEAKIYYTIYKEILQEVEYYATSNNISMVFRFNGDPVEIERPDDVLRDINKSVVYFSKGLDITPVVLERLNRRGQGNQGNMTRRGTHHGVPLNRR